MNASADSSLISDLVPQRDPRSFVILAFVFASITAALLLLSSRTPRARLNVMQIASVLFFLIVIIRQRKASTADATEQIGTHKSRRGLLLALALGAAAWVSTIWLGYISEDFIVVSRAQNTGLANLWQFLTAETAGTFFRPVGFATILLDYRLWHLCPAAYHATNLLLHLVTIAGVFYFCKELALGTEVATVASLVYAVLPSHTEAVAWMGSRFNLLSACFTIWAAVFYWRFRTKGKHGAYVAALALFCFAVLSKEDAYVFPLLLVLAEFLLLPTCRLLPALGFMLLAGLLFWYRWILLGGIGGYPDLQGRPAVLQIGFKTFEGVFIRGPAQMLLGYNWLQPPVVGLSIVASLTAAVLLAVALCARVGVIGWKRTIFFASWITLTIAPAHTMLLINPGLTQSRMLHLGTLALVIPVALLFANLSPSHRIRMTTTGVFVTLLLLGALHNLAAWRQTHQLSNELLAELTRMEPSPQPQTTFVFHDMPEGIRGVFFLRFGLSQAIRMAYARQDLNARREPPGASDAPLIASTLPQVPAIELQWTGETPPLLRRFRN